MSKEDGGPAFPVLRAVDSEGWPRFNDHGMTIRQYYKAHALSMCVPDSLNNIVEHCAMVADAMIAEDEAFASKAR